MNENPDTNSLPLTDEEIDKLLDDAEAEIEAQTSEERAKTKTEWEAWLDRDPELAATMSALKEIFPPADRTSNQEVTAPEYWIPSGVPDHLQIALSIPGEQPKTPMEHSGRLEGLLARLAREHEEECGEGSVLETALDYAPDANLRYADSDVGPDAVITMLMESDHLQLGWVHQIKSGSHDEGLQSACHEWGFVDRLSALVRLP